MTAAAVLQMEPLQLAAYQAAGCPVRLDGLRLDKMATRHGTGGALADLKCTVLGPGGGPILNSSGLIQPGVGQQLAAFHELQSPAQPAPLDSDASPLRRF